VSDDVASLTLQLLREVRADVAEIKKVQADHSRILNEHGAAISGLLDIIHAIHSRVSRIEKRDAPQPA
jgi:hypothetical protein